MAEPKFEQGDKVVCRDNEKTTLLKNKEYVIDSVSGEFIKLSHSPCSYFKYRFEKAPVAETPEPEFKKGDHVVCINTSGSLRLREGQGYIVTTVHKGKGDLKLHVRKESNRAVFCEPAYRFRRINHEQFHVDPETRLDNSVDYWKNKYEKSQEALTTVQEVLNIAGANTKYWEKQFRASQQELSDTRKVLDNSISNADMWKKRAELVKEKCHKLENKYEKSQESLKTNENVLKEAGGNALYWKNKYENSDRELGKLYRSNQVHAKKSHEARQTKVLLPKPKEDESYILVGQGSPFRDKDHLIEQLQSQLYVDSQYSNQELGVYLNPEEIKKLLKLLNK